MEQGGGGGINNIVSSTVSTFFGSIEDPYNKLNINTIVMIVVYCEWEPFYIYITRKLHVRVTGKIQFRL